MSSWGFYGRQMELAELRKIFMRDRWFFVQVSGRRRIGKTSLIHQALNQAGRKLRLYIQIPDSDVTGVLAACNVIWPGMMAKPDRTCLVAVGCRA